MDDTTVIVARCPRAADAVIGHLDAHLVAVLPHARSLFDLTAAMGINSSRSPQPRRTDGPRGAVGRRERSVDASPAGEAPMSDRLVSGRHPRV